MTITGLYNKVKSMDIDKVIDTAVDNSLVAMTAEQKKQLYAGFDKTGNKITRKYRNNKYARVKNSMNPLPGLGTPDLRLTGAFYSGIGIERQGSVLHIESSDSKNDALESKYDPFGLGGAYKKEFIDKSLRPNLNSLITKATGLKFG